MGAEGVGGDDPHDDETGEHADPEAGREEADAEQGEPERVPPPTAITPDHPRWISQSAADVPV